MEAFDVVELAKGRLYFPGAKTGEYRYVALLADTPKRLKALKAGKPNDLVFPGVDNRTESARVWRSAAVTAGCGFWHCRRCGARLNNLICPSHDKLSERAAKYEGPLFRHTRHTFIRRATNKGVPLVRVMQVTGHKNVPTHLGYNVADESDLDLIRKAFGD